MTKLNCWEYKECGRELGGANSLQAGICPASMDINLDGVHDGICAGRACWIVAGTMCDGRVMGSFATKYRDCTECDFFALVENEEGDGFLMVEDLLDIEGKIPDIGSGSFTIIGKYKGLVIVNTCITMSFTFPTTFFAFNHFFWTYPFCFEGSAYLFPCLD